MIDRDDTAYLHEREAAREARDLDLPADDERPSRMEQCPYCDKRIVAHCDESCFR